MPSRFEQYKKDESQKRELQSDLAELQTLYNSYEDFYKKYTFDEFLEYATKNSSGSLDKSIENYLIQEADKDIPLKEFRKTTVPWLSETIGGSLATARFVAEKYPSNLTRTLAKLSPNEQEIRRGTDKAFRDIGRTVGLGDIWNEKKDEETGKTYYEIQEPETTAGQILKPVGEYIAALAVTRNPTSLFTKTAQKVPEKITRKVGRPSKAALAKEAREEQTKKLLGAGKTLGKAEVAAQITFADNPEFTYVASALSNYVGNDNNLLGEILNYLDVDEQSPEEARRLSLLLDGVAFSGIVSAGVGTLKVTKEGILQMLQSVKNSSQSQKESFKSLIEGAAKTKSARKKDVPEVPIIKDITNEDILKFGKDSLIYTNLNSGYRWVQKQYQKLLTSSGMYSDEMFKMLKSADYNKIGWSKRASEIHAKLVTSVAKAAKTSKFSEKEIDDILNEYLKGKKTLASLPKEVRPWAKEAKGEITNLSKMFLESNYVPPQMKKVIEENMGSYLRKTYQFYENKNWRPSQEVIDEVTDSIAASIQKAKGTKNITPFQKQEARRVVNDILKKDNKDYNNIISHLNGVFGTKRNEVVFQQRKNIAPAIQKLLGGEEVDASLAVFRTLDTLGTQITNYKLYDDLYEKGLGKWFFKETGKFSKAPDEYLKAATIEGKQFLQLDGLRTTPEIAELFNTMARNKGMVMGAFDKIYRFFLASKGSSQAAATVFNGLTHVRNTIGGSIILMRNGINPFTDETVKSAKVLSNDLFTMDATKKNKTLSDLYEEYQRLGLVNQNVRVGEFKNLINDLVKNENTNLYSYTNNIFKKAGRKATSLYVAEDDLWRIVAYNKELNTLKKAYPDLARRNLQDLKQEAADVVRATMPTYDLIAPGLQELRKLPIGNFFSFTAEQFRNNYNTMMRAAQELRSGNKVIQDRGMNRLASQVTTTYLFSKGLTDFSKLAFGISDEDEKAVRDLNLAPWSKNSALLFSRDNKGNIQYIDLTYTDPSAPVTDNFRNILNLITDPTESMETVDRNVLGQIYEGLEFFLRPFVEEALLTEAITDITVRGGKTKEGFDIKIINPITKEPLVWNERTDYDNTREISNNIDVAIGHVLEKVLPREVTDIASLTRGKKAIRIEEGKTSLQRELIGKLTGQRLVTINPDKIKNDFSFKLRDLNRARGIYQGNINSSITKNMKAESVLSRYKEENNKNYREFVKSKRMLDAVKHFDIDPYDIESLVKENLTNYDKDEKSTFLYSSNEYIPLKISDEKLDQAYKDLNFENINFREFYDAYTVSYLEYSQLPLLEEEKQREKELERKGFFLGGLADEYQYYSQLSKEIDELPEKTTKFIEEREKRRAEAHRQIAEATKEGDVRKGFEAFETLPIGEQFAGYMNPVTNVPLSATGAGIYAEKAKPSFKSPKEFLLDFVNPRKNILQKMPIKVEDPLAAGIAVMEGAGAIPFIGAGFKMGSRGLRKIQARRGDDTMGGGGSGKPPIDKEQEYLKLSEKYYKDSESVFYSPVLKTLLLKAPENVKGEALLKWLNNQEGIKKEELNFLKLDEYVKENPKAGAMDMAKYSDDKKLEINTNVRVEYAKDKSYPVTFIEENSSEEGIKIIRPKNIPFISKDEAYAYGNDEIGYDIFMYGENITQRTAGDFGRGRKPLNKAEAEIQLQGILKDEGILDTGNYNQIEYKQYIDRDLPGGKNYEEITFNLNENVVKDKIDFNKYSSSSFHFKSKQDETQFAHALIRDRKVRVGNSVEVKNSLHIDELQSDLHTLGYDIGYKNPIKDKIELEKITEETKEFNKNIDKLIEKTKKDVASFKKENLEILNDSQFYDFENIIKKNIDEIEELPRVQSSEPTRNVAPLTKINRIYNALSEAEYDVVTNKVEKLKAEGKITDNTTIEEVDKLLNINRNKGATANIDFEKDGLSHHYKYDEVPQEYWDLSKKNQELLERKNLIDKKIPDYPYKNNWHEPVLKQLLYKAAKENKDALSVSTSDVILTRYSGEGPAYKKMLYDNKVPSTMKKLANKYGGIFERKGMLEPSDVNPRYDEYLEKRATNTPLSSTGKNFLDAIEDGDMNANIIFITPKMREKILKEGVPGFATGGLVRQKYFKGEEVSEDYPVPYAKKNPSDREDTFTKQPYSAQMEKLGLDVFQER